MTEQYLGQLALFSFNFAPKQWALCNGQLLPVGQNQALFSLLGTQFGGDGVNTFGLPNLQARAVVGGTVSGQTVQNMGQSGGEATHTLSLAETPSHTHALNTDASTPSASNTTTAAGHVLGQAQATPPAGPLATMFPYSAAGPNGNQLAPAAIGNTGGQPHANMMPLLGLNYCIAVQGIYPSRN